MSVRDTFHGGAARVADPAVDGPSGTSHAEGLVGDRGYGEALSRRGHARSTRDTVRRRLLASGDVAALGTAFVVTSFARSGTPHDWPVLVMLLLWVFLNNLLGLYDRDTVVLDKSTLQEAPRLLESLAIGAGLIFVFAPVAGVDAHRRQALEFIAVAIVLMGALRWAARKAVLHLYGGERTVIIGTGSAAGLLARKLRSRPRYGVEVVGYIDVAPDGSGGHEGEAPLVGDLAAFRQVCAALRVQRVIVAFSALDQEDLLDAIRISNVLGLKLSIMPRLFEVLGRSMVADEVEGMSLLSVCGIARSGSALAAKRTIDVAGSALALTVLSPVLLAIAAAIKVSSGGPVLFRQDRIGRGHKPFKMLKFRTMVDGAEALQEDLAHLNEAQYPMFKIAADPRVTPIGRLLRRASLDELPQLWNVLRGQMSLVGPRPLVPAEDAEVIGWHRARLDLAPGLTGPWQVLGRTAIPFPEMVKLDYRYVADWSLWNDLKLLLRTAPVVIHRRGL